MENIILLLLGAMGAALTAVAAWCKAFMTKSEEKHTLCETEKDALAERVGGLEKEMVIFKSCDEEHCGAREAFHRLQTFSLHPHKDEPPKVPQ